MFCDHGRLTNSAYFLRFLFSLHSYMWLWRQQFMWVPTSSGRWFWLDVDYRVHWIIYDWTFQWPYLWHKWWYVLLWLIGVTPCKYMVNYLGHFGISKRKCCFKLVTNNVNCGIIRPEPFKLFQSLLNYCDLKNTYSVVKIKKSWQLTLLWSRNVQISIIFNTYKLWLHNLSLHNLMLFKFLFASMIFERCKFCCANQSGNKAIAVVYKSCQCN